MIRVLALTRYDRMGASSRLRFLQHKPTLLSKGIAVEYAPFFDDKYLSRLYSGRTLRFDHISYYYLRRFCKLVASKHYDVLWIEKEVLPWFPALIETIWLGRIPYVLDMDDAWFHRYDLNRGFVVGALLKHKFETLVQQSAAVIVGNSYLEDWARSVGAERVVQLPTSVDLGRYPNFVRPARRIFNIGWLGQPTTASYLKISIDALRVVCAHPSTSLSIVGAGSPIAYHMDLLAVYTDWNESGEYEALKTFDVGIAPLSPGPWELGKSGFKAVQYMAAALPVVASRVGANTEIVQHGKTGFLVDSKDEWIDALTRLRDNLALRHGMGQAGRARVEERYSVQTNINRLAETLHLACARSG